MFSYNENERNNYQYIILEIDEQKTGIDRDGLVRVLQAENILARRYFYPGCHEMEPYRSYFPHAGLLLPNTNRLTQRVVSLPTGTAVTEQDIVEISRLIEFVLANGTEISERLAKAVQG